ncbi:MAG TPA: MFS transporter [Nevskiaceae bacterium]|nr:MFS transporter [Nevskiaceae bacterium]
MTARSPVRALPAGIWALGFVSMFMDISSELVHSLLPALLTTVLGVSVATLGMIEGVAEAIAQFTKLFSGAVSDWLGKRKLLAVIGYGLAAVTKPIFPLATSVGWVATARFVDRVGKGIRGAPRDALVADLVTPGTRGAAFGLRQALDSVGAFVGPLLAVVLMAAFSDDIQAVLWIAVVPAMLSVACLVFGVREPDRPAGAANGKPKATLAGARALPRAFWIVVAVGAVFTLARFSEAFLVLRAQDVGMPIGQVPLVMVVMNVVYAAVAFPAGALADRTGAKGLLAAGLVVLVASDVLLALAQGVWLVYAGAALWGLHMALTQGLLAKLVVDAAPVALRGTAFGVFYFVAGLATLAASGIAGWLWDAIGADATFFAGAAFAAVTLIGLAIVQTEK